MRSVPPGPPRTATFRLFKELVTDRIKLMSSAAADYGDLVRIAIGPKSLYFVNHPDYAKHVLADNSTNYHKGIGLVQAKRALGNGLLTSEGELWREQRKVIQPAFQAKRTAAQAAVVADEASALIDRLRQRIGDKPVDMNEEMTRLTLGVLGRTLLDVDLGAHENVGDAFASIQDQAMFEAVTLSLIPTWVPLGKQLRFRRARNDLDRVVNALVRERSWNLGGETPDGDDVLSRLIISTRHEADPAVGRQRMRDELVTLMLAGHETTASVLTWALHLLDRNPEVRAKLRNEAASVLGDRIPGYGDLNKLTYTSAVLQETMRLYPPVWLLPRRAQLDDEIAGYRIPAGADVVVCPYTLHRHPKYWREPEKFDPSRFEIESSGSRHRYSYIPFGAGPRFCVGNNLGMLEATFVLAMIAKDLRLRTAPGHRVVAQPMLSLRMRGGLPMTVHKAV